MGSQILQYHRRTEVSGCCCVHAEWTTTATIFFCAAHTQTHFVVDQKWRASASCRANCRPQPGCIIRTRYWTGSISACRFFFSQSPFEGLQQKNSLSLKSLFPHGPQYKNNTFWYPRVQREERLVYILDDFFLMNSVYTVFFLLFLYFLNNVKENSHYCTVRILQLKSANQSFFPHWSLFEMDVRRDLGGGKQNFDGDLMNCLFDSFKQSHLICNCTISMKIQKIFFSAENPAAAFFFVVHTLNLRILIELLRQRRPL